MKADNFNSNKSRLLTALPLMGLMIVFFSCDFQGYDEKVVLENGEVTSKSIETNEIFDVVEDAPSFPGGMEAWKNSWQKTSNILSKPGKWESKEQYMSSLKSGKTVLSKMQN
jgi:hypothetical protein